MSIYNLLLLHLSHLVGQLQSLGSGPLWAGGSVISLYLGRLVGIPKFYASVMKAHRSLSAQKVAAMLQAETQVASFTPAEIRKATKNYVWPSCSSLDPAAQNDLRNVAVRAPALKTVSDTLTEDHGRAYLLLLADSGMGKTTFCLNFYAEEMRKPPKKRRRIVVIPLGRQDALDQIAAVTEKQSTALFLDAFDEDPHAAKNPYSRLATLMEAAANYAWVVVTCRSQFFANDDQIPDSSSVLNVGARMAGIGREYPLRKLYLTPFSGEQVDAYIRGHFPSWRLTTYAKRKRAKQTIAAIGELAVRPMLLELVPDLARERLVVRELFGLYEYMVKKWLERESGWVDKDILLKISKRLAVDLYIQQSAGGSDRMSGDELSAIAARHESSITHWQLSSRSLLNRDESGNFKFAHRSILEYLFVVSAIEGREDCFNVQWTELMKRLFVSWGYHCENAESKARAIELLPSKLDRTGVLPLNHDIKDISITSPTAIRRQLERPEKSDANLRPIPAGWRRGTVFVAKSNNAITVKDTAYGLDWKLVDTIDASELSDIAIYRDSANSVISEVHLRLNLTLTPKLPQIHNPFFRSIKVPEGRLPSLAEMLNLWECEQSALQEDIANGFLDRHELYWLGDSLGVGRCLVCSIGIKSSGDPRLTLLGQTVGTRSSEFIYVYELMQLSKQKASMKGMNEFKAMAIRKL